MLNRKSKKNQKENQKKKHTVNIGFKIVIAGILCIVILLSAVGAALLISHENSVLSIYAEQQDTYVQLVLDQINIQSDLSDDEIINNILGSLDSSERKYWTLSKGQTFLYVKDVTETNRFKGGNFPLSMIYESDSASAFVENIKLNHVSHEIIMMDDDRYVASGVLFEYNNSQYRICLLTNESFILDDNAFLSSKISLYIYLGVLLMSLLLVSMILSHLLDLRGKKIQKLQNRTEKLNRQLEQLENKIESMDSYHTRWSLFAENTMDTFVHKLDEKEVRPIVFNKLSFKRRTEREIFLEKAQFFLDDKVLRFSSGENGLILIFVQYNMDDAKRALEEMEENRYSVENTAFCSIGRELREVYKEFLRNSEKRSKNE